MLTMRRLVFDPPPSPAHSSPPPTPVLPPKELPTWFELGPFRYDGRVCVAALPGLCLALALSGELLLCVVVVGGLVIHFMQSGGARRRAVLAFLCVFIAAQVSVIYSALPLVWESAYHAVTILLLNMSVVMTGGWALVHFEEFLKEEPVLAETIEMTLFTIFPTVSVGTSSCVLAMLTSSQYIPYGIIVQGFLVLRLFVTPSQPSFRKTNTGSTLGAFVLGHAEVSLLLILYVSAPAEVFIVLNFWNLLSLITVVKLLFVFTLPCFLMTLLELRTWSDCFGIPYKFILWLRWTSGLASLFLGWLMLSQTQDSVLIHWLSVIILANVLLGWAASQKGQVAKMFKLACCSAVVLTYVLAVQYSIPWHVELPDVDLSTIGLALIQNAVLSVACFLACNAGNHRLATTLLIAFMGGLVYTETYLHRQDLYSSLLMLCTSASSVYLLVRLLSSGVVLWYCVWIGSALHAYKAPFLVGILTGRLSDTSGTFGVPVVALALAVTKLLFFEQKREVSNRATLGYIVSIMMSLLLSYRSLIQPACYMLYASPPTNLQVICLVVALTSTVCLKLTTQHLRHIPVARRVNVLCLVATGLAFVIQPTASLEWQSLSSWLTLSASVLVVAVVLGIVSPDQNLLAVFSESALIGLASGVRISEILFTTPTKLTLLQYTLSCVACAFILLSLWVSFRSRKLARKQPLLQPAVCFLATVGSVTYVTELSQVTKTDFNVLDDVLTPCLRLYCVISIVLGLALRLYCLLLQSRDPFGFAPSQVSTIGNLLTISAYLLACLNCPLQPREIWNSVCALLLLNLHQDPHVITSLTPKRRVGLVLGACVFTIYCATILHTNLLHTGIGLYALLEAFVLGATLPVFATVVQHQVIADHVLNVELVVFLTPLNAFFFLVGSSYTSWLLGGIGISAGIWMLVEKISTKDL